ncbi:MAG TPA: hypothetical protein PLQ18_06190, partial [Plasticicumulans sp.]|nr:hypothetical protein [Plasticicumulans sp.]
GRPHAQPARSRPAGGLNQPERPRHDTKSRFHEVRPLPRKTSGASTGEGKNERRHGCRDENE